MYVPPSRFIGGEYAPVVGLLAVVVGVLEIFPVEAPGLPVVVAVDDCAFGKLRWGRGEGDGGRVAPLRGAVGDGL